MTDTPPTSPTPVGGPAAGIIQRAKDILLKPKETWPVIAAEPATTQSIYMPYVLVLAAIGPLAGFIGGQVFGITILGVTYPLYLDPILQAGIILQGAALGTALANTVRKR